MRELAATFPNNLGSGVGGGKLLSMGVGLSRMGAAGCFAGRGTARVGERFVWELRWEGLASADPGSVEERA